MFSIKRFWKFWAFGATFELMVYRCYRCAEWVYVEGQWQRWWVEEFTDYNFHRYLCYVDHYDPRKLWYYMCYECVVKISISHRAV